MKITSVEPQKNSVSRRTKRFNIFLDGQFAFGADEDLVVDRRLIAGKEILKEDLEKLLQEAEIGKLMERMYGLLGRRQRSEKEIRDYFRIKNYESRIKEKSFVSELVIESVIDKLKRKGLVNDLEFAKAWVESRSRKKGLNAIKSELINKGISREIVEDVLISQTSAVGEKTVAEKLLERKMKIWKNLPDLEFKQKALQFLMRRGFGYETSKQVLEKILKKE